MCGVRYSITGFLRDLHAILQAVALKILDLSQANYWYYQLLKFVHCEHSISTRSVDNLRRLKQFMCVVAITSDGKP